MNEYEKGYAEGYKDACNDMIGRLDRMKETTLACAAEVFIPTGGVTEVEREVLKEEKIMAGFRKAKAEQAALKMGFYGTAGSGKTFTALLVAEGLAKVCGKRVAVVDTERGTDWYSMDIPDRKAHPKAFDFDALYTRSITETYDAVRQLNPDEYCIIIIDSITHLWKRP